MGGLATGVAGLGRGSSGLPAVWWSAATMVGRLLPALLLILMHGRAVAQVSAGPPRWRVVADVTLPGKPVRFDYQSFDPTTGSLWIAHMGAGEVLAFDVRARQVIARVPDMPGVTGVRVVPVLDRVFASLSAAHEVAALDRRDGRVLARVPAGRFLDGLAYAPPADKLFVSDEYGRQEVVIDVASFTVSRLIQLGGEAGNTQYDSSANRIWVAVQTRNELVAIDPLTMSVVNRVPVPGIEHPHGFQVDPEGRFIYVTGEENGTVGVLDLRTAGIAHIYPVGEEPDVLVMDPARHRLFVAAESGLISAFDVRGDSLVALPSYHAPRAHSVAVDPATHLVYVPLENVQGKPVLRILQLE